jgi:hypothetical protein
LALADLRPSAEKYSDSFLSITGSLYHAQRLSIRFCDAFSICIFFRVFYSLLTPTFIISPHVLAAQAFAPVFPVAPFRMQNDTNIQSKRPLQRPFSVDLAGSAEVP